MWNAVFFQLQNLKRWADFLSMKALPPPAGKSCTHFVRWKEHIRTLWKVHLASKEKYLYILCTLGLLQTALLQLNTQSIPGTNYFYSARTFSKNPWKTFSLSGTNVLRYPTMFECELRHLVWLFKNAVSLLNVGLDYYMNFSYLLFICPMSYINFNFPNVASLFILTKIIGRKSLKMVNFYLAMYVTGIKLKILYNYVWWEFR